MSKEYSIGVWEILFYKIDEDGNELLDEDGGVKMFWDTRGYSCSYLADSVSPSDLEEY